MELAQGSSDVLTEAVEFAKARLEVEDDLIPMLITDRGGDRRVESFERDSLTEAKERFADSVRPSAGGEACALVYLGHVDDQDAILIERGGAGYGPPEVYLQRFRPQRGRFRGFKLIGKPEPVDSGEAAA